MIELKNIRTQRGLTLRGLGLLAGVSDSYLSQLETGSIRANPSLDVARRIAATLGVSVDTVFPDSPDRIVTAYDDDWELEGERIPVPLRLKAGKCVLVMLWRGFDAGGESMGRTKRCHMLEVALSLLGVWSGYSDQDVHSWQECQHIARLVDLEITTQMFRRQHPDLSTQAQEVTT